MAKFFTDEKRGSDDRRAALDRRAPDSDQSAEERRNSERRDTCDRRSQVHGIEIETRKSLIEMEEYLDVTCEDYWSAILLELNSTAATKRYRIQFFSIVDRDRVIGDLSTNGIL